MSTNNSIGINSNLITNQKYSSKLNFILTGNNISNRQNKAITSAFKKRVLDECCKIGYDDEPLIKNKVEKDVVENNVIENNIVEDDIVENNIVENDKREEHLINDSEKEENIIHKMHIYTSNILFIDYDTISFNHVHRSNIKYGLTNARYRISNIRRENYIGFVVNDCGITSNNKCNEYVEIVNGRPVDQIIVDGKYVVTLFKDTILFYVKKKFDSFSIVTYYNNKTNKFYFRNSKNIFKYINNYINFEEEKDLIEPGFNDGDVKDYVENKNKDYLIECIEEKTNVKLVNIVDAVVSPIRKEIILTFKDQLILTYEFLKNVNNENYEEYEDKINNEIDFNNVFFYNLNYTNTYSNYKKYGLYINYDLKCNEPSNDIIDIDNIPDNEFISKEEILENYNNDDTCKYEYEHSYNLITISKEYPITLYNLTDDQKLKIALDINNDGWKNKDTFHINTDIYGILTYTIDNIEYKFYYGTINIYVLGDFGTISMCAYNTKLNKLDYMGMYNKFVYSNLCNIVFRDPLTFNDYRISVQCLYKENENTISVKQRNGKLEYIFNGVSYDNNFYIGVDNGEYTIVNNTDYPIGFFIEDTSLIEIISGTVYGKKTIDEENTIIDITFYTGVIILKINGDFGIISYYSYNNEYMGGKKKLKHYNSCLKEDTGVITDDDDDNVVNTYLLYNRPYYISSTDESSLFIETNSNSPIDNTDKEAVFYYYSNTTTKIYFIPVSNIDLSNPYNAVKYNDELMIMVNSNNPNDENALYLYGDVNKGGAWFNSKSNIDNAKNKDELYTTFYIKSKLINTDNEYQPLYSEGTNINVGNDITLSFDKNNSYNYTSNCGWYGCRVLKLIIDPDDKFKYTVQWKHGMTGESISYLKTKEITNEDNDTNEEPDDDIKVEPDPTYNYKSTNIIIKLFFYDKNNNKKYISDFNTSTNLFNIVNDNLIALVFKINYLNISNNDTKDIILLTTNNNNKNDSQYILRFNNLYATLDVKNNWIFEKTNELQGNVYNANNELFTSNNSLPKNDKFTQCFLNNKSVDLYAEYINIDIEDIDDNKIQDQYVTNYIENSLWKH